MALIRRTRDLIIREINTLPPARLSSQFAQALAAEIHRQELPQLSERQRDCVYALEREGVYVTHLEDLALASTAAMLQAARRWIPTLDDTQPEITAKQDLKLDDASILHSPVLYRWGLEESLLNIVETYLGLPARYMGTALRRSTLHSAQVKTRDWHTDHEDLRMVKVIVYLSDVDTHSGPFQYISKRLSAYLRDKLGYRHGRIPSKTVASIVPESFWQRCLGRAGTVILADTATIFHRGEMPTQRERLALFYTYTSCQPLNSHICNGSFKPWELEYLTASLNHRQQQCSLRRFTLPELVG
ncbi:hypothetical protein [Gloeobacter violaceus]|uniref:Glr1312 protein n=1 Tax=Gloeobacter violaceus (strain ATCC 29082 / PCC 7421) TaxID=251221 RepID=Q7NL14_GLOVI|nr:hypothetical protein [Gloeobacter violaceus]BAC89253.1 glr1312 [Gloeobacter violaceus PCC 7421]